MVWQGGGGGRWQAVVERELETSRQLQCSGKAAGVAAGR